MITIPIVFVDTNQNPYNPSDNPDGANFTSRRADGQLGTNTFYCATDAVWSCDVAPTTNTFSVQVVFGTLGSNPGGITISSGNTGNGLMFIANGTNLRAYTMAAWVLTGSPTTYTGTFTAADVLNIDVTQSAGTYVLKKGTTVLGTHTNTTYTSGLKAGFTSRTNARIASFALSYDPAMSLDTLTTLTPGAAFSGTCTGYANGAAALSFSGVSAAVTITAGAFTGTCPMVADNVAWPRLPATGQIMTLTQGASVATLTNNSINLPAGYDTTRDESGNPANFNALVTDNAEYLAYHFLATNPLTTNDSWLARFVMLTNPVTTAVEKDYVVNQDSSIDAMTITLPRTDIGFRYDGTALKYFEHSVTLNEAGEIVDVGRGVTAKFIVSNALTAVGLKAVSL